MRVEASRILSQHEAETGGSSAPLNLPDDSCAKARSGADATTPVYSKSTSAAGGGASPAGEGSEPAGPGQAVSTQENSLCRRFQDEVTDEELLLLDISDGEELTFEEALALL